MIGGDHPDTVVYLALPPGLLPSVMPALAAAKLRAADAVAIENPSGLAGLSAAPQPDPAHPAAEPVIFRVNHILCDELVRRVIVLRSSRRKYASPAGTG